MKKKERQKGKQRVKKEWRKTGEKENKILKKKKKTEEPEGNKKEKKRKHKR